MIRRPDSPGLYFTMAALLVGFGILALSQVRDRGRCVVVSANSSSPALHVDTGVADRSHPLHVRVSPGPDDQGYGLAFDIESRTNSGWKRRWIIDITTGEAYGPGDSPGGTSVGFTNRRDLKLSLPGAIKSGTYRLRINPTTYATLNLQCA